MEKIKWIEEYINEANNFIYIGDYEQALKVWNQTMQGYTTHWVASIIMKQMKSEKVNST